MTKKDNLSLYFGQ